MVQAAAAGKITHFDSTTCPYAQRSWVALIEKGLDFEVRKVDLNNKDVEFKAVYAAINPDPEAAAKVPILLDGDTQLIESGVIVEYLERKYPQPPLLPADAAASARARLFAETFSSTFTPAFYAIFRTENPQQLAEATAKFESALKVVDAFLRLHGSIDGGDYFLGGTYSLAEVLTTGFVQRALVTLPAYRNVDVWKLVRGNRLERLECWMHAALGRPSAQQTRPADEVVLDSMRKFVVPFSQ